MMKVLLSIYLSLVLAVPGAFAQASAELRAAAAASAAPKRVFSTTQEYFAEGYQGEVLLSVKVIGAVRLPGIYHVPKKTDLVTLVAMAGGTLPTADLEKVFIKRRAKDKESVVSVDLNLSLSKEGTAIPIIEADDIVTVQAKEPVISQESLSILGFVASILSILISGLIINKQFNGKD